MLRIARKLIPLQINGPTRPLSLVCSLVIRFIIEPTFLRLYSMCAALHIAALYHVMLQNMIHPRLYSVSLTPGSDVARLFAKHSSKSCVPSEVTHLMRAQEQSVCARPYKLRLRAYVTARK